MCHHHRAVMQAIRRHGHIARKTRQRIAHDLTRQCPTCKETT